MSEEKSLCGSDVKKRKYRKTREDLRGFEGFKLEEFLNCCQKNSELVFQNKIFESNKTGKLKLSNFDKKLAIKLCVTCLC